MSLLRLDRPQRHSGKRPGEPNQPVRRIFVDVSTILRHDAHTGIQRVVRSVCRELTSHNTAELQVHAVGASKWRPYSLVKTALLPIGRNSPGQRRLRLGPGDAFLGLDLSSHLFARHESQLRRWRSAGAEIAVVVYDLLPFRHPEWFSPKTVKYFRQWLGVVGRRASLVLPISRSVQTDLIEYLEAFHGEAASRIRSRILPLSGDIGQLDREPSANGDPVLQAMQRRPSVLMVGTIEPRKGHSLALAAHRYAWSNRRKTAPLLIIAGRPGWHTEILQAELRRLDLDRDGAIWLDEVSDARLDQLYRACRCVLIASLGEGYCLPLHEALAYGKPVLARNLAVLRELHTPSISYFADDAPASLASRLIECVAGRIPEPIGTHGRGWEETVRVILEALDARQTVD